MYAQIEKTEVQMNTPISLIFLTPTGTVVSRSGSLSFSSLTAQIETALITSKLKAADPTMQDGPSSPGHSPRLFTVSITESKISGALDPRAISDRLAIVGFHTLYLIYLVLLLFLSTMVATLV